MNDNILYGIGLIALGLLLIWMAKNREPVQGQDVLLLEYREWLFGILSIVVGIYFFWLVIKPHI